MPMLSIAATLLITALTLTGAGGGIGALGPAAMADVARSTPATAAGDQAVGATQATRQIDVTMRDHAFSPDTIDVNVGETVTFAFTNVGAQVHDAFIGDKAAQEQHEKEMREHSGGHDHAHEGGVTVNPGEKGTLQYSFDKPGTLEIGCHQEHHYQAGMIAILNVRQA
jgi:uncharacterized cupredoxin-like copper-binding protein